MGCVAESAISAVNVLSRRDCFLVVRRAAIDFSDPKCRLYFSN
jgi:hypothetical protein